MLIRSESYNEARKDTDPLPANDLFFGVSPTAVIWGSAVWLVGWLLLS